MESPIARVSDGALEYKVLVLGCSEVGKTSLIRRYTTGNFPSGMMSTVGKYNQLYISLNTHWVICTLCCELHLELVTEMVSEIKSVYRLHAAFHVLT